MIEVVYNIYIYNIIVNIVVSPSISPRSPRPNLSNSYTPFLSSPSQLSPYFRSPTSSSTPSELIVVGNKWTQEQEDTLSINLEFNFEK